MKLSCTVENLKTAVLIVERFTSRHITLPILAHILCRADNRHITLIATNLELGIEYQLTGKVVKPGTVTIPARPITQILQSLSNETLTFEVKQQKLTIQTPLDTITLIGLNPNEYPTLPSIKREYAFYIPTTKLIPALRQVIPSVASSDLKPELSGVLFAAAPGTLTLVATDSFRLAERTITGCDGVGEGGAFIVPVRTAHELIRTLPADDGLDVQISVGEHQALFEWSGTKVLSRLIDGVYPPYHNIIPKTYETTLTVPRALLLEKVRLAAVFSSRLNDVTLRYSTSELEAITDNAETGSTSARIAVKGRGTAGTSVFNHRYLVDGLEAVGSEHVVMSLNGAHGPTRIQDPTDTSFLYLLMPIRSV